MSIKIAVLLAFDNLHVTVVGDEFNHHIIAFELLRFGVYREIGCYLTIV